MDGSQVRIGSYETVIEAEAVRGALESEGIRSWLTDSHLNTMDPLLAIALGHIGVLVEREHGPRAAEISRRFEEDAAAAREAAADGEVDDGKDRCVSCNAEFPEYLERCPACGLSYG